MSHSSGLFSILGSPPKPKHHSFIQCLPGSPHRNSYPTTCCLAWETVCIVEKKKVHEPLNLASFLSPVLANFVSTWLKLEPFWKWEPQLRKCLYQLWGSLYQIWGSLWGIFLMGGLCERAQFTVGGANPGLLVLDDVRKQVEQAISKQASWQHSSISSASSSVSASRFLVWVPVLSAPSDKI